ncbi:MAG: ABC transporter ATP-binding protein [Synoicihabitans sp.]
MNAIKVDHLGKRYIIGHQASSDTLRDAVGAGLRGFWKRVRTGAMRQESFWAIDDVSLEIEQGSILGIIGRNGAGKSTLLKLLSRITEPTTGRIELCGRVASLLEVGTGFHPELSGRENIYLNGAILGMTRQEIRSRFDEIVAFAEVEKFLDTPVKRYSSGMYVRLAFSVAAHLEPEILIVDEVLAVGDAKFQAKCLGKMQEVSTGKGRTILFVSHNLDSIARLCKQGLFLEAGRVRYVGEIDKALAQYQNTSESDLMVGAVLNLRDKSTHPNSSIHLQSIRLDNLSNPELGFVAVGNRVEFQVEVVSDREIDVCNMAVSLYHGNSLRLINADSEKIGFVSRLRVGSNRVKIVLETLPLAPGHYSIHLWLANTRREEYFDSVVEGIGLDIYESPEAKGLRPQPDGLVDVSFSMSLDDAL